MRFLKYALSAALLLVSPSISANEEAWKGEWPNTDFSKRSVDFSEIVSGGPPKDGIPAIDTPKIKPVSVVDDLSNTEPVISLFVNGEARAYPLRVLMWHEIANDVVGGIPVAVTYCPLCNAAIVFDRRIDNQVLDFGTTGKLRYSDLIMYDRQTESWWQQFTGEAIVGAFSGQELTMLPARIESWTKFKSRAPEGDVLVPNDRNFRDYGRNPYAGYDSRNGPYSLFRGPLPSDIPPMARVIVVGEEAWSLSLLRKRGTINAGSLRLTWSEGQNSALDHREIAQGRDVGNVIVQRAEASGLVDVVHDVTFAFVFRAFHPDGVIHKL
jgi:hypothetical protein